MSWIEEALGVLKSRYKPLKSFWVRCYEELNWSMTCEVKKGETIFKKLKEILFKLIWILSGAWS